MANWAIVVGINAYASKAARLKGAVRDAIKMREWLLDAKGGAVAKSNLILLLGTDEADVPPHTPATTDNFVEAMEQMIARSGGAGDRFYFHFSGHGLSARMGFATHSALAFSDFKPILPSKSVTVLSLFELMQGTAFPRQFFFIDACRNIVFEGEEKRLSAYPNPRPPLAPVSAQYIMYATMPLTKANEVQEANNERGAFTEALLNGLRGAGSAKRWDPAAQQYVVRWNSLFEYVRRDVISRKLDAGGFVQEPRQYGERGDEDPELGRRTQTSADFFDLQVDIELSQKTRQEIAKTARIVVRDLTGFCKEKEPPLPALPLPLRLQARSYGVEASLSPMLCGQETIDLYEDRQVKVRIAAVQPTGANQGATAHTAGIEVTSFDILADLEVADEAGCVLMMGRHRLSLDGLKPGFYRARQISPEGIIAERLLDLASGEKRVVSLDTSAFTEKSVNDIAQLVGMAATADGLVSVSEAIGYSASLRLSTMLAFAAAAAAEADNQYGQSLRRVGIPSFQHLVSEPTKSGVQVVVGDELRGQAGILAMRLALADPFGRNDEPSIELNAISKFEFGIGTIAWTSEPGSRWIRVGGGFGDSAENRRELALPVVVLPGRITLVVITRRQNGRTEMHQYSVALPGQEGSADRDPMFPGSRFAALRRVELMQRYMRNGRVSPARGDIELLTDMKWRDPIAACLGGYFLLRQGKLDDPHPGQEFWDELAQLFPQFPDIHVLRAARLTLAGDDEMSFSASRDARNCGVPIFRDGLRFLVSVGRTLRWTSNRFNRLSEILDDPAAGQLWSNSVWPFPPKDAPQQDGADHRERDGDRKPFGHVGFNWPKDGSGPGRQGNSLTVFNVNKKY